MLKSYISSIDLADGWTVASNSITLHSSQFRVIVQDALHKHLGMRMSVFMLKKKSMYVRR